MQIKELKAAEAYGTDEVPLTVKRGNNDDEFTATTAEDDECIGVLWRSVRQGETASIFFGGGPLTKLRFDGACPVGQEVALSGTTAGHVQDVANAGGGATIVGKLEDIGDAEDGDIKEVKFYLRHPSK
jgi:hypothetical protein